MLLKMPQKLLKTAHHIELGSYHHWPVLVPHRIRLYTYEQIPLFLKENPYITDGYRAHLPSKLCLRSIFILSNETVNIWSHLLGFLLFFSLGVNDLSTVLPASGANREDYVIYAIGLFCFQVCMLCSVGYHLFACHRSEKTSRRWLALDYAGISVGILGCYVPGIFYAFYCNAFWRQVYLLTVLSLILAVFCAQVHPRYLSNDWRRIRMTIFCCVAGISVIPACHWVWLNGGLSTDVVQLFLPRVIVMYLIAGSAFLFYVTKIPERYFPGQLNYLGASHQVWHILVVLMFYWWHQTAVHIMRFRHSQTCPTLTSSSSKM
ncbi:progestin and adipoQ receptor family member 3b [Halichoeres trimaculatus]|uniref:progestin and adipoQ receptor family member 3b n=1 Tax=Halichoeres trimaculatus TaxID=147232 RepID=UPI003D9ED0DA